ncbi:MAG: glycosyltransferase family 2 protein [Deltaproteobacteria bacterium]|nr:glycosyltransferase family 2 protein [Deltaproteobacteria bacterium]
MSEFRVCAVVPTYDNPRTIRAVVERLAPVVEQVLVVDDGSAEPGRAAVDALVQEGLARVIHRARNGGKGAAVKTGLQAAMQAGFSHALQVDADLQHDLDDAPKLLEAARAAPDALVLGDPRYDESAPSARRVGRLITSFWIRMETSRGVIGDAMCGFRVYPIDAALKAAPRGDAMDFDPEIAVRMVWAGAEVINIPTRVRYLNEAQGGVSHFRLVRDNVWISWMHTRLMFRKVMGLLFGALIPRLRLDAGGRS